MWRGSTNQLVSEEKLGIADKACQKHSSHNWTVSEVADIVSGVVCFDRASCVVYVATASVFVPIR